MLMRDKQADENLRWNFLYKFFSSHFSNRVSRSLSVRMIRVGYALSRYLQDTNCCQQRF